MDTKLKTHEANPQKRFVVQINASENFGLEEASRETILAALAAMEQKLKNQAAGSPPGSAP